MAGPKKSVT